MRAVVQPLRFKVFLIIAQARDNFADTVKVVPSILAKETRPAMEQPIKQAAVPRNVSHARRDQRGFIFFNPVPEIRPAVAAVAHGRQLQDKEQAVVRFGRHGHQAPDFESLVRRSDRLVSQVYIRAGGAARLIQPLNCRHLVREGDSLQKMVVFRAYPEGEVDFPPDSLCGEAFIDNTVGTVGSSATNRANCPMIMECIKRIGGKAHASPPICPATKSTPSLPMRPLGKYNARNSMRVPSRHSAPSCVTGIFKSSSCGATSRISTP